MSKIALRRPPRNRYRGFQPPIQVFNHNVNLIVVSPNGEPGRFAAHDDRGRLLVASSRQPLLDACRLLLSVGIEANAWAIMRHHGNDVDAVRGKVGILAKLTVVERDRGGIQLERWNPISSSAGSPPMRLTTAPVQFSSGAELAR
jgi:hypothetical protein